MAHAELDVTTITNSQQSTTTNLLSSYSTATPSAILKSGPTQQPQQSADTGVCESIASKSCGSSNVAIALHSLNRNQQQRRKTVYFTVGQRQEVAIFEDYTPSEDIKSKRESHPPYLKPL